MANGNENENQKPEGEGDETAHDAMRRLLRILRRKSMAWTRRWLIALLGGSGSDGRAPRRFRGRGQNRRQRLDDGPRRGRRSIGAIVPPALAASAWDGRDVGGGER